MSMLALVPIPKRYVYWAPTYSALSGYHNLGRAQRVELLESLKGLNTGTDSNGRTSVVAGTPVAVGKADVLEAVSVDNEGTPADGSAKEVMASVADDQAQVVVLGKEDTSLDMGDGLSLDVEGREVAAGARISRVGGRPAGVVGGICP